MATGTVILFHKPSATRMEVGKKGYADGEYVPAEDYELVERGKDRNPEAPKHAAKK
jgi:hypothetical protein